MADCCPHERGSALDDCNRALKDRPVETFLDGRGLTYLRLGQVEDAIADFDAALKLAPRLAPSLFVHSIASARKGDPAKAAADRAAALAIDPDVAEVYVGYGVTKWLRRRPGSFATRMSSTEWLLADCRNKAFSKRLWVKSSHLGERLALYRSGVRAWSRRPRQMRRAWTVSGTS